MDRAAIGQLEQQIDEEVKKRFPGAVQRVTVLQYGEDPVIEPGELLVRVIAASYPGGRLGQPEDLVSFAAFLCSDAASHLSGTLLPIRPVTG
jgi:NAD(P)-dependent dehydrogenase (short-subunit alcohol dehydrogenase family)